MGQLRQDKLFIDKTYPFLSTDIKKNILLRNVLVYEQVMVFFSFLPLSWVDSAKPGFDLNQDIHQLLFCKN